MNHTSIIENLAPQISRSKDLAYLGHLYTLGEMNSIAGQGRNGETNVFGDALWMVDFSLWAAAHVSDPDGNFIFIANRADKEGRILSVSICTKVSATDTLHGSPFSVKEKP